jgi:anti-sigma factor RsiW
MSRCVSEPVSWLRLERYALGEGSTEERSAVAGHLAACEACRACFEKIDADAKTALPPLDLRPPRRSRRAYLVRAAAATGAGLALAAAAIVGVGRIGSDGGASGTSGRTKGDAIAFSLVRDDDQLIAEAGGTFRERDRFKALVTCPPGMRARFEVVVFDATGASFPLEVPADLPCGNDVPIPGAFRVTGAQPVHVCLAWGEAPLDRGLLSRATDESALPRAVCKVLQPAP